MENDSQGKKSLEKIFRSIDDRESLSIMHWSSILMALKYWK